MSSNAGTYVAYGNNVFKQVNASMGQNFRVFWDGDLYDEELSGTSIASWNGAGRSTIFTADGCTSINGSKAKPTSSVTGVRKLSTLLRQTMHFEYIQQIFQVNIKLRALCLTACTEAVLLRNSQHITSLLM